MKNFKHFVLFISLQTFVIGLFAQGGCTNNVLTCSGGYYGGFEAGINNFDTAYGRSDLYNGLPRNGSYQVVQNVGQLGGGGYLNIQPRSGNSFLASHTSNKVTDRVWYANVKVVPGATYKFCAAVTLLKNLGSGANYQLGLYVNGVSIANTRVTFSWKDMCGTYTAPAGVTSVELSIRDPKKGLFFVALDDICFSGPGTSLSLGSQVWNDYDGDGKRDADEPGIGNATISLYRDNDADNMPDGPAIMTTVSNVAGKYLFSNLAAGRYITSAPILAGYSFSPNASTKATSGDPDNDVDNDNNLVRVSGNNIFTNAITLSAESEPLTDGDDANGNLTMDLGECGNAFIGDFVWNDFNKNGVQEINEPGLNGQTVDITFADGTTATTQTLTYDGKEGYYDFKNLGPGTYIISFVTPTGMSAATSNAGTNDTLDSDPANGVVSVTLVANQSNFTIDAGFIVSTSPLPKMNLGNLVWEDKNNNGVKDTNENGIGGLTLNLYVDSNADNIPDGLSVASTTTDANGYYSFSTLLAGNYIVGVISTNAYTAPNLNAASPNDDIDNDNNSAVIVNGEVRSNFITLLPGSEPTNDGDDSNGNSTLDFAFQISTTIGVNCGVTINNNGYFGGFEAGSNNFGTDAGITDLSYGLPRNGSYEIVGDVNNAGGGGYLNIAPHSGNNFMLIHTSSGATDRLWAVNATVIPGETYTFCAWVANSKATPIDGFTLNLAVNNAVIATTTAVFGWTQVCGTYTVPAGVTSVEFAIKDPNPSFGPSHFLSLDDICISSLNQIHTLDRNPTGSITATTDRVVLPISPNPVYEKFNLNVYANNNGTAYIKLINNVGQVVQILSKNVLKGKNALNLSINKEIAGGVYHLQIIIGGQPYNQTLLLAR